MFQIKRDANIIESADFTHPLCMSWSEKNQNKDNSYHKRKNPFDIHGIPPLAIIRKEYQGMGEVSND